MLSSLPTSRVADPADAPPLRWGVLGPGGIARAFVTALQRHSRQQVVAVASRDADRAEAFARDLGIERAHGSYLALVEDPGVDIVYVATPHSAHHEHALLALHAGTPVLVEKAYTRNEAEARAVTAAAEAAGLLVMEAMWTRFLPGTDVLRQLLADGALGEVHTVLADHGQYFHPQASHRLFDPELAGGALLDLGVYPVSFASFALGAPQRVTATGRRAFTGVDGQVSAVLSTETADAVVTSTLFAQTPTTASVSGSLARAELAGPFFAPTTLTVRTRDGGVLSTDGGPLRGADGLVYEAAEAARLLAQGATESPLLPWEETRQVMATMDEIRRQVGVSYPGEQAATVRAPSR
ncbi:Gfo/Idh/MocA family protein [Ornithinicoccus halotolerans]|uniref:Gfo/Idh/MocA family protein n=1 Tax=Ornithinicoccus halotolerans TaxID=1748220 RepID=UPI0018861062|nr:Gfo/Idh/MocA family oxidoreductase [Ornithinicoccus halotolerans]